MLNLTQKEIFLLEDQKAHEELCIKKYSNYSNQVKDPFLKDLFKKHGDQEQQHLDTLNQILSGQVPMMGQQQSQQSQQKNQAMPTENNNQQDIDFCYDLLTTEKFVSSTYNTAIFEFNDSNIRSILNHIQKEEQQHGEEIFNYLKSVGAYKVQ